MPMPKPFRLVVLTLVVLCVTAAARARQASDLAFTLTKIGPGVWAAIDGRTKVAAGGNAGFVIGDDGVVVVDTFVTADAAKQLLAEIRKLTQLPVKFVVNTHYHADHVGGNRVFADAVILAHRHVRGWIHPENLKLLGPDVKPEMKSFIDGLVAPTMGYDHAVDLHLGSRAIQVRAFPGHTGGDSVVIIPDAKVAFGGDLFWRNTLPNTIDASTKAWVGTLSTLAATYGDYTFVPGHGGLGTANDVSAFRDYLATLQTLVAEAHAQGKSGTALVEAVTPLLSGKYAQWDFFKVLADRNIREAEEELRGTKRVPQPK
jgi:cyclase